MSVNELKHVRVSTINDVVLIEIMSTDVQGPDQAQEFSAELISIANQNSKLPILLDMHRCAYLSSMGYSALFKLVKQAKANQRRIRYCRIHPDVKVGADIVGLHHVVEVDGSQESALAAFAQG